MKRTLVVLIMACTAQSLVFSQTINKQTAPNDDAAFMKGWVHRKGRSFDYFVPNERWLAAETTNGIDITSPTGDELITFGYATGSQKTLQQIQTTAFQSAGIRNVKLVDQGAPVNSGSYMTQTTEFTGVSKTNSAIHGRLTAQVSTSWFSAYLIIAPESLWQKDARTLQAIRNHITFMGRKPN